MPPPHCPGQHRCLPVWEPYISQQILFSGARPGYTAKNLMPGLSAIAASTPSIDSKREAIADFLGRLKKARAWVDHTDEYADLWAKKANLDQDVSRHWLRQAHMSVGPVDAQAAKDLQSTADFLFKVERCRTNWPPHRSSTTRSSSLLTTNPCFRQRRDQTLCTLIQPRPAATCVGEG